jgi:hypothetical protein
MEATVRGKAPDETLIQSSIRLPRELFDRLKAIGEQNGTGISVEIRKRLEASFQHEGAVTDAKVGVDEPTKQIIDAVAYLANAVGGAMLPWFKDRFAYEVFKECLSKLLEQKYKPKGELVGHVKENSILDLLYGDQEDYTVESVTKIFLGTWLSRLESWPRKGV